MAQRRSARRRSGIGQRVPLLALIPGGVALYIVVGDISSWARTVAQSRSHSALALLALCVAIVLLALLTVNVIGRSRARRVVGRKRRKMPQMRRVTRRLTMRLIQPDSLAALRALTPTQFELAIGDLLRRSGFREVRHTGSAGDLAADLTCRDGYGARVIVQCKRYAASTAVTSPEMQTFIGMIYTHHHAGYGIFVTTSSFTQPASALARQHNIRLLDGAALASLWRTCGR